MPGGVVHKLPADLRKGLIANPTALDAWKDITPLARNEFICWVEDAKQEMTRERRICRTQEELDVGVRRSEPSDDRVAKRQRHPAHIDVADSPNPLSCGLDSLLISGSSRLPIRT